MLCPIVTKSTADIILSSKEGKIKISLDLGISEEDIEKNENEVILRDQKISLPQFSKLKETMCYAAEENILKQIAFFAEDTHLYYKLLPTQNWPTITLSSTPMHRYSTVLPKKDTELKIKEISPVRGKVLDTCCGLGYTAIMASHNAESIDTFERDEHVLRIARYNPYSQELFLNKKIKIHQQDIGEEIAKLGTNSFDRIVHDPPTFKISPPLYSREVHAHLFRILKRKGILYHYCPAPGLTKGKKMFPRLIRQLKEVGFSHVEFHVSSSGIRALKE